MVLLALLFAVALAMRLYALGDRALIHDEAYTHWIATLSFSDGIKAAFGERTPPLQVAFMHAWLSFAPRFSEFWLRLPFAIFGALSIFFAFGAGSRMEGRSVGLIAAVMTAFSPLALDMSQFGRYPAMLMFLVSGAMCYLVVYIKNSRPGPLVAFTILLSLSLYTNYYSLLVAASIGLFALVFLRGRQRVLTVAALFVCGIIFVPCLVQFIGRTGTETGFVGIEGVRGYLATVPDLRDTTCVRTVYRGFLQARRYQHAAFYSARAECCGCSGLLSAEIMERYLLQADHHGYVPADDRRDDVETADRFSHPRASEDFALCRAAVFHCGCSGYHENEKNGSRGFLRAADNQHGARAVVLLFNAAHRYKCGPGI